MTTQPAEIHTPRGGDQLQEIHPQGPRESWPDRIPVRPSGKTNRDQAARGEGPRQRKTDQQQEEQQPERYQHRQIYFYMRVNFFDRITYTAGGQTKYSTPGFYETMTIAVLSPRESSKRFITRGRAARRPREPRNGSGRANIPPAPLQARTALHRATPGTP